MVPANAVVIPSKKETHLPGVEVLEEDVALLGLLTPVADNAARAVDNLAGITLTVENACRTVVSTTLWMGEGVGRCTKTSPFTKLLAISNLDERDLVLGAKSLDKLLVGILIAVLVENAHVSLATVESLGGLAETTSKTVVDEGVTKNAFQGILDRHLALGGSIGGNLDLLGGLNLGNL